MRFFRSQPLVALAIMLFGCGTRTVTNSNPIADTTAKPATSEADDVLTNAIYQLHPENFGINANPDKPVSLLNSWRLKQSDESGGTQTSATIPEGWMPAEEESHLNQIKYDLNDAIHVRDASLNHTIAGYLSDRERNEVQRVNSVVDFVCRNVALWKDNEIEIPLQPFLGLQFGRGSAETRAWVAIEILRQLRLDSIILRSKQDTKETSDKWLLGVIIEKQIYLFDLKLGLPVPGDPAKKGESIATLNDIAVHPEWLEQLATSEPYRITVEDIRDPILYVLANPNYWSRRMQKLEQALPATEICVLYDPLFGSHGLHERILAVGNIPSENVKRWGFPSEELKRFQKPSKDVQEELILMSMTLNLPIPVKFGDDGKPVIGAPEHKMQRYRMDQIMGKFSDATKRYLSIRHLEVEPNPPEIDRVNRIAAEDAFYWTCLCKFENKEYEAAADQIQAYLKKYDRKGKWYYSARLLLARSYAELGKLPQAISTLQRTAADDPYRIENAIRVRRWSEAITQ